MKKCQKWLRNGKKRMKNKMMILDLFYGGGGTAMGIHKALQENNVKYIIVGIDIRDMLEYPFTFIQYDVF